MTQAFTQESLLAAFVALSQKSGHDQHVSFSMREGDSRPYVNVFGPSHDPTNARTARVVIEHDGSISLKDQNTALALAAAGRLAGATCPDTGAAKWTLSRADLAATYSSARDAARAIVHEVARVAGW